MAEIHYILGIVGGLLFMALCIYAGERNKSHCIQADKPKEKRPWSI